MELPSMKSRGALALAEEAEAARRDLFALLPRFSDADFATGSPESEEDVRGIMTHVTLATLGYACWINRVLGRLDPAEEKSLRSSFRSEVQAMTRGEDIEAAFARASDTYYGALAAVTPEELDREFQTRWGDTMSVELMMEHALVHLIRHRRQLQIILGDRPDNGPAVSDG